MPPTCTRGPLLATMCALALASCGDEPSSAATGGTATSRAAPAKTDSPPRAVNAARRGTTIALRGSAYGRILFNGRRQAIYVFERDGRNRTRCHGRCARDWPPVFTRGTPRAAGGVDASLLGTIRRRDGRRQVTYAGRPLYYYVNEGPGEVRCHNVNLNGGLWWVVGRNGRPRP